MNWTKKSFDFSFEKTFLKNASTGINSTNPLQFQIVILRSIEVFLNEVEFEMCELQLYLKVNEFEVYGMHTTHECFFDIFAGCVRRKCVHKIDKSAIDLFG